jgi:hypothetical protein
MKKLAAKLLRLGVRQLFALAGSTLLAAAAIALAFTSRPALSVIPVALLLLHLTLQVIVMHSRLVLGLRDVTQIATKQNRLDPQRTRRLVAPIVDDVVVLFERVEFLQRRVLAAVETERVEAAERQQALLADRR